MEFDATHRGRIDKIIAETLPQYSRAALTKLFDMQLVWLDGSLVQPGHKVREGQSIKVDLSPLNMEQQVVELPIIFEDDNVIVVDKPSGIISHARGKYWYEPSVASFIRSKLAKINEEGFSGERAGIVHRLDRATSGVMICAKNQQSLSFLQKQFSERKVIKKYIAIISEQPEHDEAIIDAPIARNPLKPQAFRVHKDGKTAQTHYKVIKKYPDGKCALEMTPKTGRTHQLRVHLLHIGRPIVGDDLYGGAHASRLMLHASSLEITLPSGPKQTFTSKPPEDFDL